MISKLCIPVRPWVFLVASYRTSGSFAANRPVLVILMGISPMGNPAVLQSDCRLQLLQKKTPMLSQLVSMELTVLGK
jgi:hypothetical protein